MKFRKRPRTLYRVSAKCDAEAVPVDICTKCSTPERIVLHDRSQRKETP